MKGNLTNRVYVLAVFLLLFAFAIIGKVFFIQIFQSDQFQAEVQRRNIDFKVIEPAKGNIYSTDGRLLVTTVSEYEIRFDMMVPGIQKMRGEGLMDSLKILSRQLSGLFKDKSSTNYYNRFIKGLKDSSRYLLVKNRVNHIDLEKVKGFTVFNKGRYKSGFIYIKSNKRKYPHGWLAHRTLGYVRDYASVGLESTYDSILSGEPGKQLQKKVSGDWIPVSNEYEIEPIDGFDIVTTIDVNIQDVAENVLKNRLEQHDAERGCVVVMDVKTGGIRAIANLSRNKSGGYSEVYNQAVGAKTDPGSTFKLASLLVGLNDGKFKITDSVDTEGGQKYYYDFKMTDSKKGGYGTITLKDAFAYSSNVGTSKFIWENYNNDPSSFLLGLKNMGLDQKTGIEIAGEGKPLIKNVSDKSWSGITLPQMAIGYEVLQTPLQTLTFYNAIANNGRMVKPKLVDRILEEGKVIEEIATIPILDKICTDDALVQAKEMLEAVVEYGTAKSIKNPYFKIAGKTGTAQMINSLGTFNDKGKVKYQASFAGYFPADNPEYSIVVVVSAPEKAGFYASEVAAPIFKEIAYKVYASDIAMRTDSNRYIPQTNFDYPYSKNGYVPYLREVFTAFDVPVSYTENLNWGKTHSKKSRVQITKNDASSEFFMPDVKGMPIMDAIYILENKGLIVIVKGDVGYIRSQSVPKGRKIKKGQTVELIVT